MPDDVGGPLVRRGPRHSSGETRPQTGPGRHRKPAAPVHHTGTEKPVFPKPGEPFKLPPFNSANVVKGEFLIGLALVLLAPIGNADIKPDKNYARRIIAWTVLFMLLFPMAGAQNPRISRIAAGLGGLVLLALAIRGTSSGFAVDVTQLLATIVAKLQPNGGNQGAPNPTTNGVPGTSSNPNWRNPTGGLFPR